MNKLTIESDGKHTRVIMDGIDVSDKVTSIRFQHTGGDMPLCDISMFGSTDLRSMSTVRKCINRDESHG